MATLEEKEETNWYRVCRLLTGVGKDLLLLFFKKSLKPKSLREFLADNRQTLSNHQDNEWIHPDQFELLYPASPNSANEAEWDITLVCYLIRHFIYIVDEEQQKHIKNIRILRNQLHHNAEMKLNEKRYKILRRSVSFTLTKFAKSLMGESQQSDIQKKIDSIEKEAVVDVVAMRQLMQSWKDMDISLSGEMREVKESVNKNQESLEVIADNQKAMTKTVKETQKSVELIEQRQTELLDITKHQLPSQGDSVTGSLHADMEPTPGCSTSRPVSRKRKAEDNSPLSHKTMKTAAYNCPPKCETGAPGTSKSPAEEGLDAFPNLKLFQRDLIECYRTGIVKAPVTIQGTSRHTDISEIYAEPDMVKEDHRALTFIPIAMETKKEKRISYEEIFTEQHRKIYVCGDAGVGKTSFCKSLVSAWCSAHDEGNIVSSCRDSDDQQKRQSAMKKFKIVFYISLRHVTKTDSCKIKDMTLSQLLKENPLLMPNRYGMNTSEEVLEKILLQHSEECLFILDGLDELAAPCTSTYPTSSDGIPGTPYHKYTVLITSRTWKLESLRLMDINIDLKIMLRGVKSGEEFFSKLVKHFNNSNPENKSKKCQDFEEKVFITRLNDLESVPLFFKHLICLWYSGEDLEKSMTETCMNMVELLFKLGEEREKVEQFKICANRQCKFIQGLPFKRLRRCERYEPLLLLLGKLAFETIFQQDQALLVFEEDDFSSYDISSQDIDTSLKVGILSLNSVPSMTSHKRKISFLHRYVHELFAALFWASNGDRGSVDRFYSKRQILDNFHEIKGMLTFLIGMSPSSVLRIVEHLVTVVDNDADVRRERPSLLYNEISFATSIILRAVIAIVFRGTETYFDRIGSGIEILKLKFCEN